MLPQVKSDCIDDESRKDHLKEANNLDRISLNEKDIDYQRDKMLKEIWKFMDEDGEEIGLIESIIVERMEILKQKLNGN